MPLTVADYQSMLKDDYHGPMVDMLENATFFLSRIERYKEPTGGKRFYIPIRTNRTASIGARNDNNNSDLPVGDRPGYGEAIFNAKSLYATVRVTGFSMRSSNGDSLAFEKALTSDMDLTTQDMKKDVNRQLFGDGSGELARVTAIAGTPNVVTLSSALYPTWANKFLYVREIVDIKVISTGADVANGNDLTITVVPKQSNTFTYSGTAFTATTNTQGVYRKDNLGLNSSSTTESCEIFGLCAALYNVNPSSASIPSGTTSYGTRITANYGGIDRTSNDYWQGNLLTNPSAAGTPRPLSVNLLMQAKDTAEIIGGGKTSCYQTNHAIYRMYGSILSAAKQFEGASLTLDGGWEALDVAGIPMLKDHECPDYHVFALDETTLMLGVVDDWAWIGEGENKLLRLAGKDQYEGVLNRDCQLICDAPNKNCVLADIAHS